jgi:hypothetical protein
MYSQQAQLAYQTVSMKDVEMYTGPTKYLRQRNQPLEIPMDCIRKLADVIDTSFDERCDLSEIKDYVSRKDIPFEDGIVDKMYEEACSGRGFVCES